MGLASRLLFFEEFGVVPSNKYWIRWLVVAIVSGAVAIAIWLNQTSVPEPAVPVASDDPFPLPPYSETRYLNTGPDAQYIGSDACARCHKDNHASYRQTAHSQAFAEIRAENEPPDGSFELPSTGRSYRIYRKDGHLRHEEVVRSGEGKEIGRIDLPVRYVMGSGHHGRAYFVEVDGFLQLSPIAWIARKKQWNLAPGFDPRGHASFDRAITLQCVNCHSGQVEEVDGTVHRLNIHEKAIGCENCHGPGSLHQQLYDSAPLTRHKDDLTIVNPSKLSRPAKEAICATCHIGGPANIQLRGRALGQFRPGRPLSDYSISYRFDTISDQMTIDGHFEQLRESPCYQKSADMTCITCHDPHLRQKPTNSVVYYRDKCLSCHEKQPCSLDVAARLKKDPADNCTACHMPQGDTEIPHVAFTHHRIRRSKLVEGKLSRVPDLVPVEDDSHLLPADQERNLGLAYLEASRTYPEFVEPYRERARIHLEKARGAGLLDAEEAMGLAELLVAKNPSSSAELIKFVLQSKDATPSVRCCAMALVAQVSLRNGDFTEAAKWMEQTILLRHTAEDWRILGEIYLGLDQPGKAIEALQKSLATRPANLIIERKLAEAYRKLGDTHHANEHQQRAQLLEKKRE